MDSVAVLKKDKFLINLLLFLTFDLMLLGAGVRTMDAGLTCPDWPLCFGKVIPEYHFGVYLEFIHRVIAGLVAILFMVFFFRNIKNKKMSGLLLIGLFLLLAQIIMGGLTVLKLLDSIIVTLHLSLATAFLVTLVFTKDKLLRGVSQAERRMSPFAALILICLAFVSIQIVLGGLVASTYSGMICVDFPTCNGQWFPAMQGPVAIQMFHRFGAYLVTLLITGTFFYFLLGGIGKRADKDLKGSMMWAFTLIWCQVAVGVLNLQWLIPPWLSVIHLALALLVLLNLLKTFFGARDQSERLAS